MTRARAGPAATTAGPALDPFGSPGRVVDPVVVGAGGGPDGGDAAAPGGVFRARAPYGTLEV